jgi:protein-tyrosine phosphatase
VIDIHTHILPGLDDGAETMAAALEMARIALADGIHTVVATPHITFGAAVGWKEVLGATEALREALLAADLPLKVLPGAELMIDPDLPHAIGKNGAYTLGGTRYVLVELPVQQYPIYTEQTLFELQVNGFIPIMAHPERNSRIQSDLDVLGRIVQRGVVVQVTAGSILGDFGSAMRQFAEGIMARRMAHTISSDSHGPDDRPLRLQAARDRAAKIVGETEAESMVSTRPAQILANKLLPLPEPLWQRNRGR